MRTFTAGEETVLNATEYAVHSRVRVANGSGTLVDLETWTRGARVELDIDQPVSQLSAELLRDGGASLSLAPLRTDSTLNRLDDGTTYSPLVEVGRRIVWEVACVASGATPSAADWKTLFDGDIDRVQAERTPITVTARDQGGRLVDRQIETAITVPGTPSLETALTTILDEVFGAGVVPLVVPAATGYVFGDAVTIGDGAVMEALQSLVDVIGWDLRYRWNAAAGAFRLTLLDPGRSRTTPDYTFQPSRYWEVSELALDRVNVRNVVRVGYLDAASGVRSSVVRSDAGSITKYGRRYLEVQEPDDSGIDSASEATTFADAILADLKDPKADHAIELPLWWPAELHDLYTHAANGAHYDAAQTYAVVRLGFEVSDQRQRTTIATRGTPAGKYLGWLTRPREIEQERGAAYIVPTAATETQETLELSGARGRGNPGPLTFRWRTITKGVVGAWSNAGAFAEGLPTSVVVGRSTIFPKTVELEVRDGGSETYVAAYIIAPQMPANDEDTGRARRVVPFDDGEWSWRAGTDDGLTGTATNVDSTGRQVRRALAKPAFSDPDTIDYVPDGTSFVRTTPDERTGGGRGFAALSSGHRLVTGVEPSADVAGVRGHALAAVARTALFSETFESFDPTASGGWIEVAAGGTVALASGVAGAMGGNVLRLTGTTAWYRSRHLLPYDESKLYRLRTRYRVTTNGAGTLPQYCCGVAGIAADGVTLVNIAGLAAEGNQHFRAASFDHPGAELTFVTRTGYILGRSAAPTDDAAPSVEAPLPLHTDVRYLALVFLANVDATGAQTDIDFITLDILDEEAAPKVSATLDPGGQLKPGAKDAGARELRRFLGKVAHTDDDSLDSLPDGVSYARVVGTALTAGAVDLAKAGVVGRTLDNIADTASYARTTPDEKTGAGRAFVGLAATGRLQKTLRAGQQLAANQVRGTQSGLSIDSDGIATITISAHSLRVGAETISYNSGSVGILAFLADHYIYADDPEFAGGSVTYLVTTTLAVLGEADGRYYVGTVRPRSGLPDSGGDGGGSSLQ